MATDIFNINDTFTLLQALDLIEQPTSFLADTFFGDTLTVNTSHIAVEFRNEGRLLAPMISTKTGRGVDVNRTDSEVKYYAPLMFAPRRVISLANLESRLFAETPNLYSPTPIETRASQLQAEDMADLLRLHANRREQLAAQLLQTGKIERKGYADDGRIFDDGVIDYEWKGEEFPATTWDNPAAPIFDNLMAASEKIQRGIGQIPTLAICGRGVEKDLIANKEIRDWLMIPNRENLAMASFAPQYTSPEVRQIGRISALNLDLVSYVKTYLDEDGKTVPFIDDYSVILAVPGLGKTVYANTLASFIKEQREATGEDVPAWLGDTVSTYEKVSVGIRKS